LGILGGNPLDIEKRGLQKEYEVRLEFKTIIHIQTGRKLFLLCYKSDNEDEKGIKQMSILNIPRLRWVITNPKG
jgi:hypothetical protein